MKLAFDLTISHMRAVALMVAACASFLPFAPVAHAQTGTGSAQSTQSQQLSTVDQEFLQDAGQAGATEIAARSSRSRVQAIRR